MVALFGCHSYERTYPRLKSEAKSHVGSLGDRPFQAICTQLTSTGKISSSAQAEISKYGEYRFYDRFKIKAAIGKNDIAKLREDNEARLSAMYGHEFDVIQRARGDHRHRVGLSLSGGGIRSAAFASGVLQGLQHHGVLEDIGYLSTVSGGGFAGSWYMLRPKKNHALSPGAADLQHLTQYGYYLTHGHASKSVTETAWNFVLHTLAWPFAATVNELVFRLELNTWGLRDDYRHGIAEAFLYDEPLKETEVDLFRENNLDPRATQSMAYLCPNECNELPYWIVNMHLSLDDDPHTATKNRTGDAFELTPDRAGADAVGYVKVPCDSPEWMKPYYAVAISGAAADSTSGQQGTILSSLLYGLNIDLGYYIDGWSIGWLEGDPGSCWRPLVYYLKALPIISQLRWIMPPLYTDHEQTRAAARYAVTDGGHFDNSGAYALVRRGCRLIIVCDGSTDPAASRWITHPEERRAAFADLRILEERLKSDFGATIEMEWEMFSPRPRSSAGEFTDDAPAAVMLGRICNLPSGNGPDDVRIVWIKAAYDAEFLRRAETFIDRQKLDEPRFPNASLFDQSFTERAILAQRQLGYEIVDAFALNLKRELNRALKPAPPPP